jgi:hypothetical protein
MGAKSKPTLPSSIQKAVDVISKKAPVPRSPPVEDYMKDLYRRRRKWKQSNQLKQVNKNLRSHAKASLHPRIGRDHFRIMIELTSPFAAIHSPAALRTSNPPTSSCASRVMAPQSV